MLWWALAALATPGREGLEDALLIRALGDHSEARVRLLTLVRSLAADDPARGRALYWLATGLVEAGDDDGAREALRECIRTGPARAECVELLGQIELRAGAIRETPTIWTFDGDHGLVQLWWQADRGEIRLEPSAEGRALHWTTRHDERNAGTLLFGVDRPSPPPRLFRATLTSVGRDAWIAVLFGNEQGDLFGQDVIPLSAGRPATLEIPLDRATGPSGRLDPKQLDLVALHDLTARYDRTGGASELVITSIGLQ